MQDWDAVCLGKSQRMATRAPYSVLAIRVAFVVKFGLMAVHASFVPLNGMNAICCAG